MATPRATLIDLEKKFWQSMVDQDTDSALELLNEPALMVSSHGAMQFDHDGYRKMAENGSMIVTAFDLSDVEVVFPNDSTALMTYHVKQVVGSREGGKGMTQDMMDTSTWIKSGKGWKCVMHTETPVEARKSPH